MSTKIIFPEFLSVDDWRDVVKNNRAIHQANFLIITEESWLPSVLREAGFFVSNGEIKRNQPKFWRDVVDDETIKLSWAHIRIVQAQVGNTNS